MKAYETVKGLMLYLLLVLICPDILKEFLQKYHDYHAGCNVHPRTMQDVAELTFQKAVCLFFRRLVQLVHCDLTI